MAKSKIITHSSKTPNWNNIKPIYVKPTDKSPFLAPAWIVALSVACNSLLWIVVQFIDYATK